VAGGCWYAPRSGADGGADVVVNDPDWRGALQARTDLPALLVDFADRRALTPPLAVDDDGPTAYALPGGAGLRGQRVLLERPGGTTRTTTRGEGPFVGGCQVTSRHVGSGTAGADGADGVVVVNATMVAGAVRRRCRPRQVALSVVALGGGRSG
jgi:hypothetical protein